MKRLGLRVQLLAVSVLTLALPWAGVRYVTEMETALRNGLEQSLAASAVTIASALASGAAPFGDEAHAFATTVYAHPLRAAPRIDGNGDDWSVGPDYTREIAAGGTYVVGIHDRYVYLLLEIDDDRIVYQRVPGEAPYGDRIALALGDHGDSLLLLQTGAPGTFRAQRTTRGDFLATGEYEDRVIAAWVERAQGYAVEARIPLELVGERLGIAVIDVDPAAEGYGVRLDATWRVGEERPGAFLYRTPQVASAVAPFDQLARRLRVVDPGGWVLYDAGEIAAADALDARVTEPGLAERLLRALLARDDPEYRELEQPPGYLADLALRAALDGERVARWYRRSDASSVVAAAVPVATRDGVRAAVLLEQASDSILTVTDAALLRLMVFTLAASVLAAAALLGYATLLSFRVGRLARAAEHALGPQGQIATAMPGQRAADEIGDLARSFGNLLTRLHGYTEYLRTLKGKLAHELRTPLAVITSSLDNIEREQASGDLGPYLARIRQGSKRLDALIAAMSEATAIERAVADTRPERFELAPVVASCVAAYRDVYRERRLELDARAAHGVAVVGSPDLIAQLLDKLVDNAVSFSEPGSRIEVVLERRGVEVALRVANTGPVLPEGMRTQLFDSLVSVRGAAAGERRHLGLGLYIAALVAKFHGGTIAADNAPDRSGVIITVSLPTAP